MIKASLRGVATMDGRADTILTDDSSFFEDCSTMVLMDHNEFIESLKDRIPEELRSIEFEDRFGTFPITNRGIQIWLFLRPYRNSRSVFQAWLPCRARPSHPSVTINLALWHSNYYRYSSSVSQFPTEQSLEFRQLYLRYQGTPYRNATFEIDDSAIIEDGFICCNMYPSDLTENKLTLTSASPFCVKVYTDNQTKSRFSIAFGQCFGHDWIHCISEIPSGFSWFDEEEFLVKGPERVQSMAQAPPRGERCGNVWVNHTRLPRLTCIVRTSRVVWDKSRIGVRMELFRQLDFHIGSDEWEIWNVEVGRFSHYVHMSTEYL